MHTVSKVNFLPKTLKHKPKGSGLVIPHSSHQSDLGSPQRRCRTSPAVGRGLRSGKVWWLQGSGGRSCSLCR